MYVCHIYQPLRSALTWRTTHVYLRILEALLQIIIDSLVRDLADEREVGNAHLLLLGTLEDGLLDLGLSARRANAALVRGGIFLAASSSGDTLVEIVSRRIGLT